MNSIAKKLLVVGATGRFCWISEKIEPPHDKVWRETKRTSGTFKIEQVRSSDFIISIVSDDGTERNKVYCEIPKKKKMRIDEAGNITDAMIYFYDNGFKQREVDNRAGGFSYAFTREMVFNV